MLEREIAEMARKVRVKESAAQAARLEAERAEAAWLETREALNALKAHKAALEEAELKQKENEKKGKAKK